MVAVSRAEPTFPPSVDALSLTVSITLRASRGARLTASFALVAAALAPVATDFTVRVTTAFRAAIERPDAPLELLPPALRAPAFDVAPDLARDAAPERLEAPDLADADPRPDFFLPPPIVPPLFLPPDDRFDPLFAIDLAS